MKVTHTHRERERERERERKKEREKHMAIKLIGWHERTTGKPCANNGTQKQNFPYPNVKEINKEQFPRTKASQRWR
jgi:hypothetical protein